MQYRTDPKSGVKLSALGFGCMRFPGSSSLREELITSAISAGVNYFDTAHVYPGSEAALGSVLAKHNLRSKIIIADKLPHYRCKSSGDFDKMLNESLSRLQTDYIDYYLIHNLGSKDVFDRLLKLGLSEWITEKKEKGVFKRIGFSFHGKSTEFEPLLDAYNWDFCQIQYNYMNENFQAGTAGLKAIHDRGMAAIIMEPLLGGRLAQNLPREAADLFNKSAPGRTPSEWAFRWLYDKPEVTVVLSGMNAMAQLAENIETVNNTMSGSLAEDERAIYGKVYSAVSKAYKVPCTGCNYCMPCPSGVNIPACFTSYNMSYVMGFFSGIQLYMVSTLGLGSAATGPGNCTKCGVCVSKCPQSIAIPDSLASVRKRMEPFYVRAVIKIIKKIMG